MSTTDARRAAARVGRDLRHDAARRVAARGHLAHRRGQAAHRRAARLPRRALHRGRLAGRQPEGRRVLPPRRHRAARSTTSTLVAFGSTRRVEGQGRRRRHAAQPASRPARRTVCIVGKCWDYHVTEALRTTLDEGVAMVADSVEFLRGARPAGALRRRALLRRLQAQPRVRAAGARGRGRAGRRRRSCCATPTAARCPHEVERDRRARSSLTSATTSMIGIHLPRRHRLRAWPTRWPACAAAPARCRARSTATASAPATATSRRSSRTSR